MKKINVQKLITVGLAIALVIVLIVLVFPEGEKADQSRTPKEVQTEGDLVISKEDITEKASFYPYEIDGVNLEVMAVKASDGTIRTAFNTCQVCYSSGRGYYQQQGDYIVCQNCRNAYTPEEVEVISGGCNPVPITTNDKIESDNSITIDRELLEEYKIIFANWKRYS